MSETPAADATTSAPAAVTPVATPNAAPASPAPSVLTVHVTSPATPVTFTRELPIGEAAASKPISILTEADSRTPPLIPIVSTSTGSGGTPNADPAPPNGLLQPPALALSSIELFSFPPTPKAAPTPTAAASNLAIWNLTPQQPTQLLQPPAAFVETSLVQPSNAVPQATPLLSAIPVAAQSAQPTPARHTLSARPARGGSLLNLFPPKTTSNDTHSPLAAVPESASQPQAPPPQLHPAPAVSFTFPPANVTMHSAADGGGGGGGSAAKPPRPELFRPYSVAYQPTASQVYRRRPSGITDGAHAKGGLQRQPSSDGKRPQQSEADLEATDAELKEALESVADPVASARQIEELRKYSQIESLDYGMAYSDLWMEQQWSYEAAERAHPSAKCCCCINRPSKFNPTAQRQQLQRTKWFVSFLVGLIIGLVAFCLRAVINLVLVEKFKFINKNFLSKGLVGKGFGVYLGINFALAVLGSMWITFLNPAAGGSGVPEVKAFLNGSNVVGAFTVTSLVVKLVGMVMSVASSLLVGPDPLIHTGAMLGGWISQARIGWVAQYFGLDMFRNDRDRRDFISMGTACGVAAIFDSPIGGTLFATELSSFWRLESTWQTLFATVVASVTTNGLNSGVLFDDWGRVDASSILFGTPQLATYGLWELIPIIVLATGAGCASALFNTIIANLHRWRRATFYHVKWLRVAEVALISVLTSTVCFWLVYATECRDVVVPGSNQLPLTNGESTSPFTCDATNSFNDLATVIFGGQQAAVKRLFTRGIESSFEWNSLVIGFLFCFFFLACTVAVSVAGGLIIPLFFVGGLYGRFVGRVLSHMFPSVDIELGVYAIMGASSFMGGVTGLSISVCVIMLEITNDLVLVMPIVISVLISRTVRARFIGGLYEEILKFKSIPFIANEPDPRLDRMRARDLMSGHPKRLERISRVRDIVVLLSSCSHNGFPVTKPNEHGEEILCGLISRKALTTLLANRPWKAAKHMNEVNFVKMMSQPEMSIYDVIAKKLKGTPPRIHSPQLAGVTGDATVVSAHQLKSASPLLSPTTPMTAAITGSIATVSALPSAASPLATTPAASLHPGVTATAANGGAGPSGVAPAATGGAGAPAVAVGAGTTASTPEEDDYDHEFDVGPYMNHSPYVCHEDMIGTAAFRQFRSVGARHMPVISDHYTCVGIITRSTFLTQAVDQKYARLLARIRFQRTTRMAGMLPPLAGGLETVGSPGLTLVVDRPFEAPAGDNFE